MKRTAHFGVGKMGRRWLQPLHNQTDVVAIVDPDPRSSRVADRYNAEFFNTVATASEEGLGHPLSTSVIPTTDVWSITTPVYSHASLSAAGLSYDVPYLITEKPLSVNPSRAEQLAAKEEAQDSTGIVNYIERMNPVVKAVVNDIGPEFEPTQIYHWRSKTSRNIHPYARNDLGHDLSEIHRLYQTVGSSFELAPKDVSMETWQSTERFPDHGLRDVYDASANVKLEDNNGTDITIRGSFDSEHQRRYFMWIDDHTNKAFFGSTVERDHLTPVAARIAGKDDVAALYDAVASGDLVDDTSIHEHLKDAGADILFDDSVSSTDVLRETVTTLLSDDTDHALAHYRDGATYERVLHDIYMEGPCDNMYEKEEEWLEEQTGTVRL